MDTARDYRILVAEDAVNRLERRLRQWGLPWPFNRGKALESLERARKTLLKLKYSYLPVDMVLESQELKTIVESAREIADTVMPKTSYKLEGSKALAFAEIRYALLILIGLPSRISLGEANHPEYAVDVVGVEVTRVEPLPRSDKLKLTRASAGTAVFTIVTNLDDIRVSDVRAAAILPPVEFSGVVSEAMYSSDPIDKRYIGKRVPRSLLSSELKARIISLVESR
ncbi:MAG: tRNA-binding protein [Desulfurococcales archaeon]|nr:tRNA-binding protein [Desulfurococcales archaeon]